MTAHYSPQPPLPSIQLDDMSSDTDDHVETKDFAPIPRDQTIRRVFSNNENPFGSSQSLPIATLTRSISNSDSERFIGTRVRRRSISHHLERVKVPSRKWLHIEATFWRLCMSLGMVFHDWAPQRAPKPAFRHKIPTDTIPIELLIYTPPKYKETLKADSTFRFPAVINFHGGGFVLGDATDDRYWARVVMQRTNAIFVSVNYRRAPEHPFPTPVNDCADAILYVVDHATELNIDPGNIALSGFSAGANLAFAAPFRIRYHYGKEVLNDDRPTTSYSFRSVNTATTQDTEDEHYKPIEPVHSTAALMRATTATPLKIRSIIAWYPLLDWTKSRSRKIRESRNPDKCLAKVFTDLFDVSYLPPPDMAGDHCSPYASPGLAHDYMIQEGLPKEMQMWLCEWDMLLSEGFAFADRLERLGKNIDCKMIPRVPHAWDKSVNPFRDQKAIDMLYTKAAMNLNKVFQDKEGVGWGNSMSSFHPEDPIIARQPRRSVVLPL